MEANTKSTRMWSLMVLYDMHTSFFAKGIVGITDDAAHNRLGTKANHVAWITGSLVEQRFELARQLGTHLKQAADELFKNHQGIKDDVKYPSLSEFQKDWDIVTPVLKEALMNVTDEKLDEIIDMGEMKMPFYDLIAFIIYREANCIGQIALWRRLLGYEALKYE